MDLIAISAQATGFIVWPIIENRADLWIIPVTILLISFGWWENYISKHSPIPFIKKLGKLRESFDQTRYFNYMFISIWKIICFFLTILFVLLIKEGEVAFFFTEFSESFNVHPITVAEVSTPNDFNNSLIILINRLNLYLEVQCCQTYQK